MSRITPIVASFLLAACGNAAPQSTLSGPTDPPTGETALSTTTSSIGSTTTTEPETGQEQGEPTQEEFDAYLTGLDAALAGTPYAEAVAASPEVFIAAGLVFCQGLEEGRDLDSLLEEFVTELTGAGVEDASDEDLTVTGAIVGAAVGSFCPEYLDLIQ